ncbi:hypothetical protein AgCh_023206 [Apium graveolens]
MISLIRCPSMDVMVNCQTEVQKLVCIELCLKAMASNNRQKKAFGLFNIFRSTATRRGRDLSGTDDFVKSYKVYRSDEDRGRWVADPGIDKKASVYIAKSQMNWNLADVSN